MGIFLFYLLWVFVHQYYILMRHRERWYWVVILSVFSTAICILSLVVAYDVFYTLLFVSFVYISYTDIKYNLIYNEINVKVFICNVFLSIYSIKTYLFSLFFVLGIVGIFVAFMRVKKKEYIGGGDLKLIISMIGVTGVMGLSYVMFISSLICLCFFSVLLNKIKKKGGICFGPFLCIGYIVFMLFEELLL